MKRAILFLILSFAITGLSAQTTTIQSFVNDFIEKTGAFIVSSDLENGLIVARYPMTYRAEFFKANFNKVIKDNKFRIDMPWGKSTEVVPIHYITIEAHGYMLDVGFGENNSVATFIYRLP